MRHMTLARSRPGSSDHTPASKDAFARATASLTASSPQSVNSAICSSVTGLMTGITSPVPGRSRSSSRTVCSAIVVIVDLPHRP